MGDPDPAHGFSGYLELMLRECSLTIKLEVVKTGVVAMTRASSCRSRGNLGRGNQRSILQREPKAKGPIITK